MGEARHRPAIPSFGLLAVLNVGFKNVGARHAVPEVAERRAPCTDGPLTHFASHVVRNAGWLRSFRQVALEVVEDSVSHGNRKFVAQPPGTVIGVL